jgi:hypothetical protein
MPNNSTKVRVIVTPDFGERLRSLPVDEPIWVADTPVNNPVIKQIWAERKSGITSFRIDEKTNPDDWLLSVLDEIDLHHGEHSQFPPYGSLCVSGTSLSAELRGELESYGFNAFDITSDGFVANKVAA